MSRFTKAMMVVLAAACGGLGFVWWKSFIAPPDALIGEWSAANIDSSSPALLQMNRDGTYTFRDQKGKWHMEGDQVILEAFSDSYDEQLKLSEDGMMLSDGYVDGTTFVRNPKMK